MKDLIIVGAGGFGREALYITLEINKLNVQWNIKGFIDDNLTALDNLKCDYKVIGRISDWQPNENEVFVMGIAAPKTKEKLSKILIGRGAEFVTIIHPKVTIQDYTTIGLGCVIGDVSFVGDNVTIGNFVHIAGSMIGQDSIIGDYSTTTGYVNIASARLGKRVFVGSHSVVLNHLTVGDDVFICAGSVVFRKIKSGTKVLGYPAKKLEI